MAGCNSDYAILPSERELPVDDDDTPIDNGDDDDAIDPQPAYDLVLIGSHTGTGGSPIQTLIPANNGEGCFAISQEFAEGAPATLQFFSPTEIQEAHPIESSAERGMFGLGVQMPNRNLAVPYGWRDSHGVLLFDESGNQVYLHDFKSIDGTETQVGFGVVAYDETRQKLFTVAHNAPATESGYAFELGPESALIGFYPENASFPQTYDIIYLGTINAVGLHLSGDQALVASAGDFAGQFPAQVSVVDLVSEEVTNIPSFNGLGFNGHLSEDQGTVVLTGIDTNAAEGTGQLALTDGVTVRRQDLAQACPVGYIAGAHVMALGDSVYQIYFNSSTYDYKKNQGEMTVSSLTTTDPLQCEPVGDVQPASTIAGIIEYDENLLCAATESTIFFYQIVPHED